MITQAGPIFLVWGVDGDYEDRTEWVVDAWTTRAAAKARVKQLESCRANLRGELNAQDEKEPNRDLGREETDEEYQKWRRWSDKRARIKKRWARRAGDSQLTDHTRYSVGRCTLRGPNG